MHQQGCGIVEYVVCGIELPGVSGSELDGVEMVCTACGEGELVVDGMGCFSC